MEKFSAALYLYPTTFEDRGVQIAVIDCTQGLAGEQLAAILPHCFPLVIPAQRNQKNLRPVRLERTTNRLKAECSTG